MNLYSTQKIFLWRSAYTYANSLTDLFFLQNLNHFIKSMGEIISSPSHFLPIIVISEKLAPYFLLLWSKLSCSNSPSDHFTLGAKIVVSVDRGQRSFLHFCRVRSVLPSASLRLYPVLSHLLRRIFFVIFSFLLVSLVSPPFFCLSIFPPSSFFLPYAKPV